MQVEQPSTLQLSVVQRWLKSRAHTRPVTFSLALQTRYNALKLSKKIAAARRQMMMRRAYIGSMKIEHWLLAQTPVGFQQMIEFDEEE